MARRKLLVLLVALAAMLALVAAGCGGGDDEAAAEEPAPAETAPAETAAPAETEAPAETGAADTGAAAPSGEPIVIGAAIDLTGNMAPFDGPALAAAQYEVDQINAAGGINGQPVELTFIDTQLDPEQTKAAAIDLIDNQGAQVLIVTCDVDFATPAVQEAINRGVLAVAPCIGTDQMGPKRFGDDAGRLAFTVGNLAQDEGAAMAEFAYEQGWTRAAIAKDNVIVYFQDVVDSFAKRFEELGGEIVLTEEWVNGDGTVGNVASALADADVDVIATSTAFGDMPALVEGVRSLGDDTPFICGWSCDGTYWNPEGLSNFYLVTYASVAGDDPNPDVQALIDALAAQDPQLVGTGGFVTGAGAIDAIAAAITEAGSTDGAALADAMEGFQGVPTISGEITYSPGPEGHGVTGREYRVMQIQDGTLSFIELRAATSPADVAGAGE
jgi:branched-chain amino acid transport system substrate-binding protein